MSLTQKLKQKTIYPLFACWYRHRRDVIYLLIIANIIIWAVSYQTASQFYSNYINMPYGAEAKTGMVSATADILPQPLDKDWALDQWEALGGKKLRDQANLVFFHESGLNEDAHHCNTNGSVDLGFYQLNSIHPDLTIKCAGDLACSTSYALKMYREQGWTPWVAAKKLNIK